MPPGSQTGASGWIIILYTERKPSKRNGFQKEDEDLLT